MTKILLICLLLLTSSVSFGQNRNPKNMDEAISYFEKKWNKKELEKFKNKNEKDAVTELHFSTGAWIRNNWIRNETDSCLRVFFNNMGIQHPDEISSIILTSLHRKLNNLDVDLQGQIDKKLANRKPNADCEKKEQTEETKTREGLMIWLIMSGFVFITFIATLVLGLTQKNKKFKRIAFFLFLAFIGLIAWTSFLL